MEVVDNWQFFDYVSSAGHNEIKEWLDSLSKTAKAEINAMILAQRPSLRLERPVWGQLDGGLVELRVKVENVQYRPIGCYGPGRRREFTFLVGATKKAGKSRRKEDTQWDPRNALDLAGRRKAEVQSGVCRVNKHDHS